MKIGEAIKTALKETKTTQTQLQKRINAKTQSVIAMRCRADSLSTETVIEMLDEIGYELVIQPRKPGKRPAGQIVIDGRGNTK